MLLYFMFVVYNVPWYDGDDDGDDGDMLLQMTDVSLLKNPVFLIPCLANLFAAIGLFIPFVYIVDRAVSLGVQPENAAFLISVIGWCRTDCLFLFDICPALNIPKCAVDIFCGLVNSSWTTSWQNCHLLKNPVSSLRASNTCLTWLTCSTYLHYWLTRSTRHFCFLQLVILMLTPRVGLWQVSKQACMCVSQNRPTLFTGWMS